MRVHYTGPLPLDSQTPRGSDGSLASSAEHSFDGGGGVGGGGGGGVYSGSSGPRRLAVASVHRFGHHPPCAGSPHDLASCPACPASAATTAAACPYGRGKVRNGEAWISHFAFYINL